MIDREAAATRLGAEAARLARALSELGEFGLPPDWTPERGLEPLQAEALRKMLVAVIGDVRLVVVKLAEQLRRMRGAKTLEGADKRKLAVVTREVYAPLANRLGVWQVKWELEDLAFRYLQPAEYRHIAAALKVRRTEREHYIEELKERLERELRAAGVEARIDGRPKHIYSIWRKMQAKKLAFEQIMDIRAARVLVDTVAECYAALGIVHSLWQFIPGEFDDYIATPKHNFYRSIHTAVLGPGGQPVEIQIRTHEMHAHSERGVAAHWRYKEGGRGDQAYERKINQLRALLTPEEKDTAHDFLDRMRASSFRTASTCFRPRERSSMCPWAVRRLDFAYQVHTDLGHRTRGAKVNGRMVPLDYALKNSETVEIITGKTAHPSRDWLASQSGFLASARHRNKVRAWFRKQEASQNKLEGRAMLDREIQRLGVNTPSMPELLAELKLEERRGSARGIGLGRGQHCPSRGGRPAPIRPRRTRGRAGEGAARRAARARARGAGGRRFACDLRALLQAGIPRADRGLHHRRTGRHHPHPILLESRPPCGEGAGANLARRLGHGSHRISGRCRGRRVRPPRVGARCERSPRR